MFDKIPESEEGEEGAVEGEEGKGVIVDRTETNLVALRKTIYLTIQSSLDFEECAHKLLRMELKPGQEIEMAHMFLDCCAEQRTYEKFYGLLSQVRRLFDVIVLLGESGIIQFIPFIVLTIGIFETLRDTAKS